MVFGVSGVVGLGSSLLFCGVLLWLFELFLIIVFCRFLCVVLVMWGIKGYCKECYLCVELLVGLIGVVILVSSVVFLNV